jgi:hypothetical protein
LVAKNAPNRALDDSIWRKNLGLTTLVEFINS